MERHEMAEKLVEKCGITYEEAAEVLREAGYDMLEAMIILERRGKLKSGGSENSSNRYSTGIMQNYVAFGSKSAADAESFGEFLRIAAQKLAELLRSFMRYRIVISKGGREMSLPLIIGVLLVCFTAGLVFAAVLLSLMDGWSYSIRRI